MTSIIFLNMNKGRMKLPLNKMEATMGGAAFERGRSGAQCLTCKVQDS